MHLRFCFVFLVLVLALAAVESRKNRNDSDLKKKDGSVLKGRDKKAKRPEVEEGKKKHKSKRSSESHGELDLSLYNYCYDDDDNPYVNFATKTPYKFNRNKNKDEIKPQGCEAKQFWLLSRHGTRNPSTETLIELQEKLPLLRSTIFKNHKEGRGALCKDDQKNLAEWRLRANVTEDKYLVKEGFDELEDLGERYQDRFPKLLSKPYVNGSYILQYTDSERTDSSAQAFAEGLFGKRELQKIHFQKSGNPDTLLRFYKSCKKWKKEVDDNPDAIKEKTLFEQSQEFSSMIVRVSERLGFETTLNLTVLDWMYTMCTFDKAWRPKKNSPWCAAFSQEDLKILEYREDLEYYWEDGYGYDINYIQACPPIVDIVQHFTGVVEEKPDRPKGIFYFTHSGTILKVIARLGLFKDQTELLHSNRHLMENRQWRTSFIDSFATNIAVVLFRCNDRYKVGTFVQERPVLLPGCGSKLCPFEEFTTQFGPIAQDCDLNQICRI